MTVKSFRLSTQTMRKAAVLALSMFLAGTAGQAYGTVARSPRQHDVDVHNIVLVTEDTAMSIPGCDGISAFNASTGDVIFRGNTHSSPGRLAATSNLDLVLAMHTSNQDGIGFILGVRRNPAWGHWENLGIAEGPHFAQIGGIAVSPDDRWLYAALAGQPFADPRERDRALHPPPHGVGRWALDEIEYRDDGLQLGPRRGYIETAAPVAVIIPTTSKVVHLVTDQLAVLTVAADLSDRVADDIAGSWFHEPEYHFGRHIGGLHATVTSDGRYVLANRGHATPPSLAVFDLAGRTSHLAAVPTDLSFTGGVSFDHAEHGLLALHARDTVSVLEFHPPNALLEVHRAAVGRMWWEISNRDGPALSVAWAGRGRYLIAAEHGIATEFAVFTWQSADQTLDRHLEIDVCSNGGYQGMPNGISTVSERFPPPWPGLLMPTLPATAEPTSTQSPTTTGTPWTEVTSTASPTPAATSEPTATASTPEASSTPSAGPSRPAGPPFRGYFPAVYRR